MKTLFLIGDQDDTTAIGAAAEPLEDWEGIEIRGIDPAKMTIFHSILTGDTYQDASSHYQTSYAASDYGPWVFPIPQIVVERLAELDDDMESVAEELAATEEFESAGWSLEQVEIVVSDLAASARLSVANEKNLYMWMGEM